MGVEGMQFSGSWFGDGVKQGSRWGSLSSSCIYNAQAATNKRNKVTTTIARDLNNSY